MESISIGSSYLKRSCYPVKALRAVARIAPWLVWNPVVKYCERMCDAPYGMGQKIMPLLNRKPTNDSLIDACGMFSVFGWGILWGHQLARNPDGQVYSAKPPPGSNRAAIPTWRFGHITIKFWHWRDGRTVLLDFPKD